MDGDSGSGVVETDITLAVIRRKDGYDVDVSVAGRWAAERGLTGEQARMSAASFLYAMADALAVPSTLARRVQAEDRRDG